MLRRFAEAGGECLKSGALVILIIMYIAASMLIGYVTCTCDTTCLL